MIYPFTDRLSTAPQHGKKRTGCLWRTSDKAPVKHLLRNERERERGVDVLCSEAVHEVRGRRT